MRKSKSIKIPNITKNKAILCLTKNVDVLKSFLYGIVYVLLSNFLKFFACWVPIGTADRSCFSIQINQ